MENLKYVLEMENITKEFPGVKALDNVQLKLKPGTVHALMGENGAGKSTLMKCLFGIYEKDNGKILLDGVEVNFKSTKEALENGVSMVHQELNQVLQRNVLDNIWLGRYPMKGLFVDEKKMYNDTINIFKDTFQYFSHPFLFYPEHLYNYRCLVFRPAPSHLQF